jgi:EmrB/QacA subfamily drug resistance transporter
MIDQSTSSLFTGMSRKRILVVTAGIMLSLFLSSMESTVVATAMPTIVGQLGGLQHYAWVFAAYMVASTTTVPLYGKLSDLYGRRRLYVVALALFLVGSVLCGMAASMPQLIAARAVQGAGAGGILPLAFIFIGEMFSMQERARMQGFFSGVWGVSSIVGPLLGGFIVDQLSWPWVFYVNVLPGLLAAALVVLAWQDQIGRAAKPVVDYAGAALLTAGLVTLLVGLMEPGSAQSGLLLVLAGVLFAALLWVEQRAVDPILPLPLFRQRLFVVTVAHGTLAGMAMFGSISFVPLFVQLVLVTSALQAGITVTPMLLGWVGASIISTRIMFRVGYRTLGMLGTSGLVAGAFLLARADSASSQQSIMFFVGMMGVGMGICIPPYIIAVQATVERRLLGTATSMVQFSRSMGGTVGVSLMGAALSVRLAANLKAGGLDPGLVSQLLDPLPGAVVMVNEGVRLALANAIRLVFVVAFIASAVALLPTLFAPRTKLADTAMPAAVEA